MKQRIIVGLLCAAVVFTAAGCNPMSRDAQNEETGNPVWKEELEKLAGMRPCDLPNNIVFDVSDTLSVDMELRVSKELETYEIPNLRIRRHLLEPTATVDKIMDYLGITEVEDRISGYKGDFLENGQEIFADTVLLDEGMIQARELYFSFSLPSAGNSYYFQGFEERFKENEGQLFPFLEKEKDLEFCTIADADKEIREFWDLIGVEMIDDALAYSASTSVLAEMAEEARKTSAAVLGFSEEEIEEEYPLEFRDEQELYYFVYQQGYEGVPYTYLETDLTGTSMTGSLCEVKYREDGIIDVNTKCFYDIEQVLDTTSIYPFSEILQSFIELYKDNSHSRVLKGMQLEYLPVMTDKENLIFETKLIWVLYLKSTRKIEGKEYSLDEYLVYDAVTGELLYDVDAY